MKRKISAFVIIVALVALLSSCGKGNVSVNSDEYFWTSGTVINIFTAEDGLSAAIELQRTLLSKLGTMPKLQEAKEKASHHEIIIGQTVNELSIKAYNLLERRIETDDMAGYLVYSNGTSVAIAYTIPELVDDAINAFIDTYLIPEDGVIALQKGAIIDEAFNLYDYYDELDETLRAQQWADLEKHINEKGYDGKGTVEAFKRLYALYSDSAYIWLANLYDPITGGFYYSNSARETVKFAPDLESTRQALDLLRYSGMTENLGATLPEDMKVNLVAWVQSLQRSNGLYYHPQWDNYVTTDERLGRDVTNARAILSIFGARPNYSTRAMSKLDAPLSSSTVTAVSKVVSTASGHLASEEAFIKYLDSQNWNDSYTSGNRIAAQFTLICEAGLGDVCLDYMDKLQNPETGMWSDQRDDNAVNGFLKISAMYASFGRIINYSSEAADTCIDVLRSEAEPSTVCWVYNVWYSLGNIIGLLGSESATAEHKALAADIRARLCEDAAEFITIAAEKYAPFRKDDGSFSFTKDSSADKSQGMPVCVSRMREGDVNATYISIISVPARIFAALGYTAAEVDVYTPNDYKKFLHTLTGLGEIEKTNTEWGGALQFNGDSLDGMFYGTSATEIDTKPDGRSEENHAYAYIAPESDGSENRVLTFGKIEETYFNENYHEPRLEFRTLESGGTRYIYEMDICFEKGTMSGSSWHTRFAMYNASGRFWYMLCYTDANGKLCLDSLSDPLAVLEPGKWYNLRFEYYTDSAIAATDKICMVYLDGEYIGDGGVSGAAGKDSALARCMMEFRAQSENVEWRLDNVNTTTDEESYIAPPPPDFGDATGKYYTDASIKKTRYDYDAEDALPPVLVNNNGSATTEIIDGALIFAKAQPNIAGEDAILFKNALNDAFWKLTNKTSVVEFDLNYSNITATTPMKWRFGKDMAVTKSGDSLILSYKYNGTSASVNLGTSSGEWNNIRLEQYWYKQTEDKVTYSIIKIFVNDEYRGELLTDYNSATDKFYIYLFNAEKTASLMIDNLLFAHVDLEYVQETALEPDVPTEPETPTEPEKPTEPEPPTVDADATGKYYLSDAAGKRYDYDADAALPQHQDGQSNSAMENLDGAVKFTKTATGSGTGTTFRWTPGVKKTSDIYVFEADMKFENVTSTTIGWIRIAACDKYMQFTVNQSGDNIIIYVGNPSNGYSVKENVWQNVRIECDFANGTAVLCIDNVAVYTWNGVTMSGASGSQYARFSMDSSAKVGDTYYFDNVYMGFVDSLTEQN